MALHEFPVRRVHAGGPHHQSYQDQPSPRVDYQLTPLGSTLLDTIQTLVAWAGEHGHEITAARAAYDARATAADESAASAVS